MSIFSLRKGGYSIAEMSVVIVATGLLIFAGFKGFDIVKNAKVTSLIKQVSEIRDATVVFKDTNGYYPGDIASSTFADFSNTSNNVTLSGFPANRGDNDGLIEWGYGSGFKADGITLQDCSTPANLVNYANESTLAFYQLYYGNYVSDYGAVSTTPVSYSVSSTAGVADLSLIESDSTKKVLPTTKIPGVYLSFYASPAAITNFLPAAALSYNLNNIIIGKVATGPITTTIAAAACAAPTNNPFGGSLNNAEALSFDTKFDDSSATTGFVRYADCSASAGSLSCVASSATTTTNLVAVMMMEKILSIILF